MSRMPRIPKYHLMENILICNNFEAIMSQQDETKEPLIGDFKRQNLLQMTEDEHLTMMNERGDHNPNPGQKKHALTEAFLIGESGSQSASQDDVIPQSSSVSIPDDKTHETDQDTGDKRIRTESPDSEIVVIDDNGEHKSIGSGPEYDVDAGVSTHNTDDKEYDTSIDNNLPETVTLLTASSGSKLYLVGTAHFSTESQNDVAKMIQAVQPHIVMVELCKARVNILQLDEKTILEEAQKLSFENIRNTIQQNGLFNGLMYILLLNMSARLTKELGMAPGGEFRRAFAEAKNVPNCLVHMGDRPINITIQRALSSLSWWQTLKLGWHLLASTGPISKEEVERCKRRDLLEEMLAEITGEFPILGEVFVKERDLYLTHSLQLACLPQRTATSFMPVRVVGVVGIGHVSGIVKHWGKVKTSEIPPILRIPPPSLSSKVLRFTVKASFVGAIIFIGYKIIPMPSGETIQSLKSSVGGFWKRQPFLNMAFQNIC
ncbi:traB domain-containing protein isoform X2 [Neodiprion fabricii]|uniref:traB domain-containing protein isoform X2 n=1 Tax=Neodiprion fabricii TaxID=2872261 RepID=UPI001ED8CF8B|nr:traB domain-containing protein isoform X2 [Neodiprion fabricii]